MNLKIFSLCSLKTRVTLLTLVIFIGGIWSLEFYTHRTLRQDIKQLIADQQFSTASFVAEEVNNRLNDRLQALSKIADQINPTLLDDTAALQSFLEARPILQILFNAGFFVTGVDGTAIASLPLSAERVGVNYMDRDFISAALKEGKTTIGRPVIGKQLRAPIIVMGLPIRDPEGKVLGVLAGVTNLSTPNFLDQITKAHYGKTGGYILTSSQYRMVISASEQSRIMETLPTPGNYPLLDRFVGGYEGSGVTLKPNGVEVLTSAKGIPLAAWFVEAWLPTAEAFASIHAMQQRLLLATIILSLLASVLTWWLLTHQLAPLLAAIKTLSTISESKQPPSALPVSNQDEIGDLIDAFNRLLLILAQRESALLESVETFRAVFESANDGICLVSPQGNFTKVNKACARMHGYTVLEMQGLGLKDLDSPASAQLSPARNQALLAGESLTFEVEHLAKDGHEFPLEVSANLAVIGGQRFFLGFMRDISARKKIEAEIRHLNESLEQRVEARTAENFKLQAHLNQAQKMEAIGVLAGGIAHDFNNILASILGFTELAREDAQLSSQAAKDLDRVLTSAHRAKDLVKQILAFSRQTSVDRFPMRIQELVKESLKMLRASIPSTIAIKEDIHPQAGVVFADPTQIHQIVMNLCTNAYHAMAQTGGTLTVRVKSIAIDAPAPADGPQLSPGEYVELTVTDTGTGIGPDTLDKIFDPFFTTKEIGQGTGMGLSIAHGIIKDYGGTITVDSTVGLGTTFHCYFPVIEQEEAKTETVTQETPRGQGHILFVDDEVMLIEMGKALLERLGYTVSAHCKSDLALADFMTDPAHYDLVITDQTMPDLTGIELASKILEVRPELPIILCTGFSNLIDKETATDLGIREFVMKPLTVSSIGHLIQKVLQGKTG